MITMKETMEKKKTADEMADLQKRVNKLEGGMACEESKDLAAFRKDVRAMMTNNFVQHGTIPQQENPK